MQGIVHSILHKEPYPISSLRLEIPKHIDESVQKALAKDMTQRYQNTQELIRDLKKPPKIAFPKTKKSIAVLPFTNMSADPEQEYFCDGMAEELINALTKIKDLHVVARTSSFAFKGEKVDIREVGEKLNVNTLLEGSVRKAGNRVRITAQLISMEDGYHIWSERYDRDLEDVFAIQDEITENIVDKLKAALDISELSKQERCSINLEAYDMYLRGRYYLNKFIIDKAIAYYKQAIKKDPDYAPAYAALAEAFVLLSTGFDILPSKEAMPKAREAALKALQIEPTLAEAYVSLGMVATCYDWDRRAAEKYFRKAIKLNPNSASAHQWIEFYLTYLEGKLDEALAEIERAQDLDPMNLLIKLRIGYMYYFMREFDQAMAQFQKIIDLEPNFPPTYHGLMDAYGQKRMFKESLAAGEKMLKLAGKLGRAVAHIGVLGFYYALAGKTDKAHKFLSELEERSKKGYVSSFWVGTIYHGLGETDKAFEWFERAFKERDGNLIYITIPPPFDSLRTDPRFKQLMVKMGLENLLEKKWLTKPR